MNRIVVDREHCVGCEACVAVCPVGAVRLVEGRALINEDECVRCGACIHECPMEAVRLILATDEK